MILRTEAVVLRSMEYGETSRIVTLFTRTKGKISVLAKGARHPKSRFGATLQPMSYIQAVYYYKPGRGLQTLSESAHIEVFHRIGRDLERISAGLRIVELVQALMEEEEQQPLVFDLLLQVLHWLDAAEANVANLLPYFQLKLAAVLGFSPAIERDAVQALPEEGGLLAFDTGGVFPLGASPRASARASRTGLRAFAIFARADLDVVMRMRLTPEVRTEVNRLIEDYLRFHVEDAYPTRSNKIIGQLLRNDGLPA